MVVAVVVKFFHFLGIYAGVNSESERKVELNVQEKSKFAHGHGKRDAICRIDRAGIGKLQAFPLCREVLLFGFSMGTLAARRARGIGAFWG